MKAFREFLYLTEVIKKEVIKRNLNGNNFLKEDLF